MDARNRLLVGILEGAFGGKGWQGTTLLGSLRGVTAARATWRPGRRRHGIWELALHAAYWKYAVWRRLTGQAQRGTFPRAPSDWPAVPARPTAAAWRADIRLLRETHVQLVAAVAALPPNRLGARSPTGQWTHAQMIAGVAAHDAYHTGQIQLIKKLRTADH